MTTLTTNPTMPPINVTLPDTQNLPDLGLNDFRQLRITEANTTSDTALGPSSPQDHAPTSGIRQHQPFSHLFDFGLPHFPPPTPNVDGQLSPQKRDPPLSELPPMSLPSYDLFASDLNLLSPAAHPPVAQTMSGQPRPPSSEFIRPPPCEPALIFRSAFDPFDPLSGAPNPYAREPAAPRHDPLTLELPHFSLSPEDLVLGGLESDPIPPALARQAEGVARATDFLRSLGIPPLSLSLPEIPAVVGSSPLPAPPDRALGVGEQPPQGSVRALAMPLRAYSENSVPGRGHPPFPRGVESSRGRLAKHRPFVPGAADDGGMRRLTQKLSDHHITPGGIEIDPWSRMLWKYRAKWLARGSCGRCGRITHGERECKAEDWTTYSHPGDFKGRQRRKLMVDIAKEMDWLPHSEKEAEKIREILARSGRLGRGALIRQRRAERLSKKQEKRDNN